MIKGQLVKTIDLPSRGYSYPDDIEVYVRPMTIKEEVASSTERFETSKAMYYQSLLDSIDIIGSLDKKSLLFNDIQLLDLVRRLFTFDPNEMIGVEEYKCHHCQKSIYPEFRLDDIVFTDLDKECFGKSYTFSDGLTVKVSPITMHRFIKICRKFLSNIKMVNDIPDLSDYVMAYYASLVIEIEGREFESQDSMFNYVFNYFSNLYKNKDRKILNDMDMTLTSTVSPLEVECQHCSGKSEVYVSASMRFCQ